jgi:3'(2'), 5'-bisphosphate nucleotidase
MLNSPEVRFAVEAVREAALLARRVQQELVTPALTKEDRSPVTVADFAVQALVAKRLADQFADHVLVGEESSATLREAAGAQTLEQITRFVSQRISTASAGEVCNWIDHGAGQPPKQFWTLDPIDGTKGFLRGQQYAVALAYVVDGEVQIGVLGCPELEDGCQPKIGGRGTLAVAVRGQGARCCDLDSMGDHPWRTLKVSGRDQTADARLLRSVEAAHTNTGEIGQLIARLGISAEPVSLDSQAKYVVLAAGAGDVLVRLLSKARPDYRECIWDQAAGSIVVTEAGGSVTDLDGKPLDFSHGRKLTANRGILATNGRLHNELAAGLKSIGA